MQPLPVGLEGPLENLKFEAAKAGLTPKELEKALIETGVPIVFFAGAKFATRFELDTFWFTKWVAAGGDPARIPRPDGLTPEQRELIERLNQASEEALARAGALPRPPEAAPSKPNGDTAPSTPAKRSRNRSQPKPTGEER